MSFVEAVSADPDRFAPPSAVAVLHEKVAEVARNTAAVHAERVDADACFPAETIVALRAARVLSAQLPAECGGAEAGMRDLGDMVSSLAQACASSAMVLAMHFSQVACLARHCATQTQMGAVVREIGASQWLLASMTSEVGTGGDTRRSKCAVAPAGDRARLVKDATTGSYNREADIILATARRDDSAAPGEQVLVMVRQDQRTLEQTTSWNTLGMRGTCSPGFRLTADVPAWQVSTVPFAEIFEMSMVPYSHILWSALWTGIAASAVRKAAGFVREQLRRNPGAAPPAAVHLAALSAELQAMRSNWRSAAEAFDDAVARDAEAQEFGSLAWALRMNNLKVGCSEAAPRVVHGALQAIGVAGYKNDSPFSVGREYRDALSGALMISNDRIAAASASLLLMSKGV